MAPWLHGSMGCGVLLCSAALRPLDAPRGRRPSAQGPRPGAQWEAAGGGRAVRTGPRHPPTRQRLSGRHYLPPPLCWPYTTHHRLLAVHHVPPPFCWPYTTHHRLLAVPKARLAGDAGGARHAVVAVDAAQPARGGQRLRGTRLWSKAWCGQFYTVRFGQNGATQASPEPEDAPGCPRLFEAAPGCSRLPRAPRTPKDVSGCPRLPQAASGCPRLPQAAPGPGQPRPISRWPPRWPAQHILRAYSRHC